MEKQECSGTTFVLCTLCGTFLYAICAGFRDNFGIMLPAIVAERGLSYATVSFIIALGQLFFGLMQPVFGFLSVRKSPRLVLFCGIFLMLAGLATSAVTSSAALLTLAMGILLPSGTAAASFGIIMSCLLPVFSARQAHTASGFIAAGIGFSICILAPLLQYCLASRGLAATLFLLGMPIILLVPIIFSVAFQYKFPVVYIGLPMLASLSVAHGLLPPHPSPVALVAQLDADIGQTLVYGLILAIPAIVIAGPLFSQTLKGIQSGPITLFEQKEVDPAFRTPSTWNSFLSATLPVFLLVLVTLPTFFSVQMDDQTSQLFRFVGSPTVVMLAAVLIASYTLGLRQGRSVTQVMGIYTEAVKEIANILLIIAGSGVFKQVMEESGVSLELATVLSQLPIHPLVLGWLMAAIIRGCIGSATVAALTASGMLIPLTRESGVNPNLMVLAIGSGSLMFSHVNDSGFWMFKEYFNISIKDTLRSWSVMEIIVSVVGICGVMVLNLIIE